MKLERTEFSLNARQLIILALVDYNRVVTVEEMNLTLIDAFPQIYMASRPAAQTTFHALARRGYMIQGIQGWRLRPLGKRVLKEVIGWLVEKEEAEEPAPIAVGNVVPLK